MPPLQVEPNRAHEQALKATASSIGSTNAHVQLKQLCNADGAGCALDSAIAPGATIDSIAREVGAPGFDLVKLDLGGSEILALMGATSTIAKTQVLIINCAITFYASDISHLIFEVVTVAQALGFRVVDVANPRTLGKWEQTFALTSVDVVFLRADSPLWDQKLKPTTPPSNPAIVTPYANALSALLSASTVPTPRETKPQARQRKCCSAAGFRNLCPCCDHTAVRFSGMQEQNLMRKLQSQGLKPHWILDGGANKGDWSSAMSTVFPKAQLLMLEANKVHKQQLAAKMRSFPRLHVHWGLVGANEGENVTFFTIQGDSSATGASMFKENTKHYEGPKTVATTLTIHTIDAIVKKYSEGEGKGAPMPVFEFVKLDIQGAEIPALVGASAVLKNTEVIMLECSVLQYNAGGGLMFELMTVMRSLGFVIHTFYNPLRWLKPISQIDTLWIRAGGPYQRIVGGGAPLAMAEPALSFYKKSLGSLLKQVRPQGAVATGIPATASVSGKPMVTASPNSSFLGRIAHMEELLYGSSRGGAILSRLAALEKDMLQTIPGSTLPEKAVASAAQRVAALEAQLLPTNH